MLREAILASLLIASAGMMDSCSDYSSSHEDDKPTAKETNASWAEEVRKSREEQEALEGAGVSGGVSDPSGDVSEPSAGISQPSTDVVTEAALGAPEHTDEVATTKNLRDQAKTSDEPEQSAELLKEAIKREPNNWQLHQDLAVVEEQRGNFEEAERLRNEAAEIFEANEYQEAFGEEPFYINEVLTLQETLCGDMPPDADPKLWAEIMADHKAAMADYANELSPETVEADPKLEAAIDGDCY